MPLLPGARLGPYEILCRLVESGMGTVYRAQETRLGRLAALEVLREDVVGDPTRRRRFEREARAAAAFSHPNIVALYDVGYGYLDQGIVDGETLSINRVRKQPGGDGEDHGAAGIGRFYHRHQRRPRHGYRRRYVARAGARPSQRPAGALSRYAVRRRVFGAARLFQ